MDIFVEQLVSLKKSGRVILTQILIWIVCVLFAAGFVMLGVLKVKIAFFAILMAFGLLFLAYYLTKQLNLEYEYIITNLDIDIDCIIAKSKRKRMTSFSISDIVEIEKFNPAKHVQTKKNENKIYFACTPDEDTYAFTIRHKQKGTYIVIFSPNERFLGAVFKFLPYNLKKAFENRD